MQNAKCKSLKPWEGTRPSPTGDANYRSGGVYPRLLPWEGTRPSATEALKGEERLFNDVVAQFIGRLGLMNQATTIGV